MMRSVDCLDLPEAVKSKLVEFGYEYCEDLERALTLNQNELPSDVKTVIDEYNLAEVFSKTPEIVSGVDLWNAECSNPPVAIFHKELDQLLGGGFEICRITELCGLPGSGKTQICLQAAIDAQVPTELGGSAGEVFFMSTDFGFSVERLSQMARESVKHMAEARKDLTTNFSLETILNGIKYVQVIDLEQIMEFFSEIETHLNDRVNLFILDSFSFPLVCEFSDPLERTRTAHYLLDILLNMSLKFKFAILITNQMTSLVLSDSETKMIPALGEGFGHRLHKRLLLDDGKICVIKSIDQPQVFTEFQITNAGIR